MVDSSLSEAKTREDRSRSMSDIAELQSIVDHWVERFVDHDLDGCVDTYVAEGAIYQPSGPAAEGLDAVRSTFKDWLEAGETNKKIVVSDGRMSGDLAYCIARYSGDYPSDDGSTYTESGVVVIVYLRGDDGVRRIRVSSLNSDHSPSTEDG
jgi:ketosteroid isomerase-like protein